MPFDTSDDRNPMSGEEAEDEHPYTVIREWQTPDSLTEDEETAIPPAPPAVPEKIAEETPPPPPAVEPTQRPAESVSPEPPAPRKKKRHTPLFFIIWGLVIAAAIVIILLLVKRGVDASSVQAPEFMYTPQAEETGEIGDGATEQPMTTQENTEAAPTAAPLERLRMIVKENTPLLFIADTKFFIPGEEAKLDRILAALPDFDAAAFTVFGHTADTGKPNAQFVLSAERAIAVRDYLLQHKGKTRLDITIIGRGANDPVVAGVPGGPPVPLSQQAANRRAEIRVDKAE